jgi:hypothetical protein
MIAQTITNLKAHYDNSSVNNCFDGGRTELEPLPHHPKVKGSNQTPLLVIGGGKRKKLTNKR